MPLALIHFILVRFNACLPAIVNERHCLSPTPVRSPTPWVGGRICLEPAGDREEWGRGEGGRDNKSVYPLYVRLFSIFVHPCQRIPSPISFFVRIYPNFLTIVVFFLTERSKFKSLVRIFRFVKLKSNRCTEGLFLKKQKKYGSNSNPMREEKRREERN